MKRYEVASLLDSDLLLDGISHKAKLGKHCIWVPDIGIKFIISLHGQVESTSWKKGKNADKIGNHTFVPEEKVFQLDSIISEHHIVSVLAHANMMPPTGPYVFSKTFISSIFYPFYCDCYGIWGYEIADANKLPKGQWNYDRFVEEFINTGIITASTGALGDLKKEDNVVNGYLVDVRRTQWDMIKLKGDK
jgi:hypothetical protein